LGPATGPIHLATTPLEAMALVLATFGQFERRLIG
jgi:hypothetical protein